MKKLNAVSYWIEDNEIIEKKEQKCDFPWWLPKRMGFRFIKRYMRMNADCRKQFADDVLEAFREAIMSEIIICDGDRLETTLTLSFQDSGFAIYATGHFKDKTYGNIIQFY